MSPIEHIWDHLGRQVGHPTSLNELEARLQQIWRKMSPDIIQNLYASMSERIALCIRARGGSTWKVPLKEPGKIYTKIFDLIVFAIVFLVDTTVLTTGHAMVKRMCLPPKKAVKDVERLMRINRTTTVREIATEMSMSKENADIIITLRVTTKWGTNFFAPDETWRHHFYSAIKSMSMEWRHPSSPLPKKARSSTRAGKVMVTCFFDLEDPYFWNGYLRARLSMLPRAVPHCMS
ncbi:transposable element Tcb1 transposase [Trichonephila clavipes]|nr:transposable element Tcb1 transposase [Trichonephila clavipes]